MTKMYVNGIGDEFGGVSGRARAAVARAEAGRGRLGDLETVLEELQQLVIVASQDLAELDESPDMLVELRASATASLRDAAALLQVIQSPMVLDRLFGDAPGRAG